MRYKIRVVEEFLKSAVVEADSKEEAIEKAWDITEWTHDECTHYDVFDVTKDEEQL